MITNELRTSCILQYHQILWVFSNVVGKPDQVAATSYSILLYLYSFSATNGLFSDIKCELTDIISDSEQENFREIYIRNLFTRSQKWIANSEILIWIIWWNYIFFKNQKQCTM